MRSNAHVCWRAIATTPDGVCAGLIAAITRSAHEHARDGGRERVEQLRHCVTLEGRVGEGGRLDRPTGAAGFVHQRRALDEHLASVPPVRRAASRKRVTSGF